MHLTFSRLLISGGNFNDGSLTVHDDILRYDQARDSWTDEDGNYAGKMTEPRAMFALAALNSSQVCL